MLNEENLLSELSKWHERMEEQYRKADEAGEIQAAVATARAANALWESYAKRTIDVDDNEERFRALEEAIAKLIASRQQFRSQYELK